MHSYEYSEEINILMGLVPGGELFDVIHTEIDDIWTSGIPERDAKFYAMVRILSRKAIIIILY